MSNKVLWAAIIEVVVIMAVYFHILYAKLTKIEDKIDSLIKEKKHNETDCSVRGHEDKAV